MASVKDICDKLETECKDYPSDVTDINKEIDQNMAKARRSPFYILFPTASILEIMIKKLLDDLQDTYEKIRQKIKDDILPFIFAPYYLAKSGDDFGDIARDTSSLAGRMAEGQILPAAEWSGVGFNAYETTRGQQEEAAKVTAASVQTLSEQLHTVATNMVLYWDKVQAAIAKFLLDSLAQAAQLVDVKKWTEVVPTLANIANGLSQLIIDQLVALHEYLLTQVPLMDTLNREMMASDALPGGNGWPAPGGAMTQPSVPGEPPTWNDGED